MWQMTKMRTMPVRRVDMVVSRLCALLARCALRAANQSRALCPPITAHLRDVLLQAEHVHDLAGLVAHDDVKQGVAEGC